MLKGAVMWSFYICVTEEVSEQVVLQLADRGIAAAQQCCVRYSQVNDIIWKMVKQAQVPSTKKLLV